MVTGGDALAGIAAPDGTGLSGLRVFLDAREVTGPFRPSSSGGLVGLVEGLPGSGELRLAGADGRTLDSLPIGNHPAEGSVFSGPHQQPFICETNAFVRVSGETLGMPLDDACSIERRVYYAFRSIRDGGMKPLANPDVRPADLATTTTVTGATVPFIVRIETGTHNRAVCQIVMPQDPATDDEPDP